MSEKETVDLIVGAIKKKKKDVVSFIQKHGGVVKKTDSDIKIGKELSKVLRYSKKNQEEFSRLLKPVNASGDEGGTDAGAAVAGFLTGGLSSIFGVLGANKEKQIAEQQGSDAITLALINAGIQRENKTNWLLVGGVAVGIIVVVIIGILLYQKYKK